MNEIGKKPRTSPCGTGEPGLVADPNKALAMARASDKTRTKKTVFGLAAELAYRCEGGAPFCSVAKEVSDSEKRRLAQAVGRGLGVVRALDVAEQMGVITSREVWIEYPEVDHIDMDTEGLPLSVRALEVVRQRRLRKVRRDSYVSDELKTIVGNLEARANGEEEAASNRYDGLPGQG